MSRSEWNPWLAAGLDNGRRSKVANTFPVYTADLDEDLLLVLGDEVRYILWSLGYRGADLDEYGSLLVQVGEGEYTQVWGCTRTVPLDSSLWYDLLPDYPTQPGLFDEEETK